VRSLQESVHWRQSLFRDPIEPVAQIVPGSPHAQRVAGLTHGDSPAEPRLMVMVFAEAGSDLVTLSIRSWERDDVRPVIDRIAGSLEVRSADPGAGG
jgi:hypothetical protein